MAAVTGQSNGAPSPTQALEFTYCPMCQNEVRVEGCALPALSVGLICCIHYVYHLITPGARFVDQVVSTQSVFACRDVTDPPPSDGGGRD